MRVTTIQQGAGLSVYDYRCDAGPESKPFTEVHKLHSLAYVGRGSLGCRTLGAVHEFVAGAMIVGRLGQEFMATHDHHACMDECLSVKMSPEVADSLGAGWGA